jgi:hypothetical protein
VKPFLKRSYKHKRILKKNILLKFEHLMAFRVTNPILQNKMRNFCDQHLVEHFTRNVLLLSLLGNKKKQKKTKYH